MVGLACAVTPLGVPDTDNASGPLNVPCAEPHDSCVLLFCPTIKVTLAGLEARVQLATPVTTSVTEDDSVTPPPVAETVKG